MAVSHRVLAAALGFSMSVLSANSSWAGPYVQTNLVSDIAGLATLTDPVLVNPWGLSHTATSPFWTSNQGTNTATLYAVTGSTNVSKVNINPPAGNVMIPPGGVGAVGPTGQVSNTNTSSFPVGNGGDNGSAHFIFANLNGTISAWDTGPTAFIQVMPPAGVPTVYSGLGINQAQTLLYAANDAGAGSINVFNSSFAPAGLAAGAFATPAAISSRGLVPFNVRDISGNVYVTYAPSGRAAQLSATAGMGAVAIFTESGVLLQVLINGSELAAPWGIALAPADFGQFSNDLLVGNFSTVLSEINAFDPMSGAFLGTIPVDPGSGNTPGGLWSLDFGIGGMNGSPNTLYITDGIDGEAHGLFAAITPAVTPAPEPGTLALLAAGLLSLGMLRRFRGGSERAASQC